jgi:two-component system response regulator MtrA
MRRRALLVESDEEVGFEVRERLRGAGFSVLWVHDGASALSEDPRDHDVVILDLDIPDARALPVLRHVRSRCDAPVLVLSGTDALSSRVRALHIGADDALTKPVLLEELLERVLALLRRPGLEVLGTLRAAPFLIDLSERRAWVAGRAVRLTPIEFDLLAVLARRPGAAVSRIELCDALLDLRRGGGPRALDVHVSRLRRKLGSHGRLLRTAWGVGYRLDMGSSGDDPA